MLAIIENQFSRERENAKLNDLQYKKQNLAKNVLVLFYFRANDLSSGVCAAEVVFKTKWRYSVNVSMALVIWK